MKEWIYQNLWEILQGDPPKDKDYRLTPEQRIAIREILRDTKKDLPEYWRQG